MPLDVHYVTKLRMPTSGKDVCWKHDLGQQEAPSVQYGCFCQPAHTLTVYGHLRRMFTGVSVVPGMYNEVRELI